MILNFWLTRWCEVALRFGTLEVVNGYFFLDGLMSKTNLWEDKTYVKMRKLFKNLGKKNPEKILKVQEIWKENIGEKSEFSISQIHLRHPFLKHESFSCLYLFTL